MLVSLQPVSTYAKNLVSDFFEPEQLTINTIIRYIFKIFSNPCFILRLNLNLNLNNYNVIFFIPF